MKSSQGTLNGFLDQGCTIRGDIVFNDLLRVHGHAIGSVASKGELLVGEGGIVEGEVTVGRLVVAGTVQGTVRVKERLVIHGTGKVIAEVHTPVLLVDEGGLLEGKVVMERAAPVPVKPPEVKR
jgi:cytoskeletal protein CcmA (bactofilin family)